MQILAIPGSIRAASLNRRLLEEAQRVTPDGIEVIIADIHDIPLYNSDHDPADEVGAAASVVRLRQQIRAANAVLIATPEYNHGIPGVLKNALDWASRPFGKSALIGKPAAVIGGGGMTGGVRAQVQLRQVLNGSGMHVMSRPEMLLRFGEVFKDGVLVDEKVHENLQKVLSSLADWARKVG
jgi:chromate reductase